MNDDFDVQRQLQEELDSGERIVWQARAKTRLFAGAAIIPAVVGVIWLSVVAGSVVNQTHGRFRGPLVIMFLPALVGLLFVALPFFQFLGRRKTYYLLTNRRAMILTLGRTRRW